MLNFSQKVRLLPEHPQTCAFVEYLNPLVVANDRNRRTGMPHLVKLLV